MVHVRATKKSGQFDARRERLSESSKLSQHSGRNAPVEGVSSSLAGAGGMARLLYQTIQPPRFTADALAAGFAGLLVVELALDEDGRVVRTQLVNPSGFRIDDEALMAAKGARYLPARNSAGQPIASSAELRFRFAAH